MAFGKLHILILLAMVARNLAEQRERQHKQQGRLEEDDVVLQFVDVLPERSPILVASSAHLPRFSRPHHHRPMRLLATDEEDFPIREDDGRPYLVGGRIWWSHLKGSSLLEIDIQTSWWPANLSPDFLDVTCVGVEESDGNTFTMTLPSSITGSSTVPFDELEVDSAIGTVGVRYGRGYILDVVSPDKFECSLAPVYRYFRSDNELIASNADDRSLVSLSILVDILQDNEGPNPIFPFDGLFMNGFVVSVATCTEEMALNVGCQDVTSNIRYFMPEPETVGLREIASVGASRPIVDENGIFRWDMRDISQKDCGSVALINVKCQEISDDHYHRVEATAVTDFAVVFPLDDFSYEIEFQNLDDAHSTDEETPFYTHPLGPMVSVSFQAREDESDLDLILFGDVPEAFRATLEQENGRPIPLYLGTIVPLIDSSAQILIESQCSHGSLSSELTIQISGSVCGCLRNIVVRWECTSSLLPPICYSPQADEPIIIGYGDLGGVIGEFGVVVDTSFESTQFTFSLDLPTEFEDRLVVRPPDGRIMAETANVEIQAQCLDNINGGDDEGLIDFSYIVSYDFNGDTFEITPCMFQIQCLKRSCNIDQSVSFATVGNPSEVIAQCSLQPNDPEIPLSYELIIGDSVKPFLSISPSSVETTSTETVMIEAECLAVSNEPLRFTYEMISEETGLTFECQQISFLCGECHHSQDIKTATIGSGPLVIGNFGILPEGLEVLFNFELVIAEEYHSFASVSPQIGSTDLSNSNSFEVIVECLAEKVNPIEFSYRLTSPLTSDNNDNIISCPINFEFSCVGANVVRSCVSTQTINSLLVEDGAVVIGDFSLVPQTPIISVEYELNFLDFDSHPDFISVSPLSGTLETDGIMEVIVECFEPYEEVIQFSYEFRNEGTSCVFDITCTSDDSGDGGVPLPVSSECDSLCPFDKAPICHHNIDGSHLVDYICVPYKYADRIEELLAAGDFTPRQSVRSTVDQVIYDCWCNPVTPIATAAPSPFVTGPPTKPPTLTPTNRPTAVGTRKPSAVPTSIPFISNPPAHSLIPPWGEGTGPEEPTQEPPCSPLPEGLEAYCHVDGEGNVDYIIETNPSVHREHGHDYFEPHSYYTYNGLYDIYHDCWCYPVCPERDDVQELPTLVKSKASYWKDSLNFCIAVPKRFDQCSFEFQHDLNTDQSTSESLSRQSQVPNTDCTSDLMDSDENSCKYWSEENGWGDCYRIYCTSMPWENLYEYYGPHATLQDITFYGVVHSRCELADPVIIRGREIAQFVETNFLWSLSFSIYAHVNADEVRAYSEIVQFNSVINYLLIVDGIAWGFEDATVRGEILFQTTVQWPYRLTALRVTTERDVGSLIDIRIKEDCNDIGAAVPEDAAFNASRDLSYEIYGVNNAEPCLQQWIIIVYPGEEQCDITDLYRIDFDAVCQPTLIEQQTCPLRELEQVYSEFQVFSEDFCTVSRTIISPTGILTVHHDISTSCESEYQDYVIDWYLNDEVESLQNYVYFQAIISVEEAEIVATELETVYIDVTCEDTYEVEGRRTTKQTWYLYTDLQGGPRSIEGLYFGWEDYPVDVDLCWIEVEDDRFSATKFWFNLPHSIFPAVEDYYCKFKTYATISVFYRDIARADGRVPDETRPELLEKREVKRKSATFTFLQEQEIVELSGDSSTANGVVLTANEIWLGQPPNPSSPSPTDK